jgi:hypothetical protein
MMYVHIKHAWHHKVEIAINCEIGPFCDAFNLHSNDPIFNIHWNIIYHINPCLGHALSWVHDQCKDKTKGNGLEVSLIGHSASFLKSEINSPTKWELCGKKREHSQILP